MALAQDATGSGPVRQQAQANWDQQAEQAFGLGRGQGRQLMTQEEWQEHQQKMQTMSVEDRERYRQEVHERMSQRAREKGISPSERPQPRGPMGGPGTGGSGRTGGSGMGGRSSGGRRGR
ncbi:MAG: hypothetical protein HYY65_11845 [Candidatus Tectomicrobia bacterium]|uniref:Uncharacterized protein n=1 Tax=Tectimicrobiota bacterium TaxID=2528274 RepID=A0A932GRA9_UNCTE|nr:hypothetical protein [Candidatus Tectomicrobia bacterium]